MSDIPVQLSRLDYVPISPYNLLLNKIAASGPEKIGHARPVDADFVLALLTTERGENAQNEDQKRCEKTISPYC